MPRLAWSYTHEHASQRYSSLTISVLATAEERSEGYRLWRRQAVEIGVSAGVIQIKVRIEIGSKVAIEVLIVDLHNIPRVYLGCDLWHVSEYFTSRGRQFV